MRIAIIKLSTDTTKETNAFNHSEMQCKRYKKKILQYYYIYYLKTLFKIK